MLAILINVTDFNRIFIFSTKIFLVYFGLEIETEMNR